MVLAILLMAVLFGMAGLTVDGGTAILRQRLAQSAADAGALAGAADLPADPTAAEAQAKGYASKDGFTDDSGGVTVAVVTPPTDSASMDGAPNAIQVTISQQVPTTFLRILGIPSLTVAARAIGYAAAGAPCALCVLSYTAPEALHFKKGSAVVNGAGVMVNSSASNAIYAEGTGASLQADSIGMVGGAVGSGGVFNPTPQGGILPVPDPLESIPPPEVAGSNQGSVDASSGTTTINPGIYTNLSASGTGGSTLVLNPGVYVITGQVSVSGNGTIQGDGVTLYFTCSAYSSPDDTAPCQGASGGNLDLSGNSSYQLSAPTSGPYQGLVVFYDRGNTAPLVVSGNGSDTLVGTIYAKDSAATFEGNGMSTQFNSLIVTNTVLVGGNGAVTINYDASQNVPVYQMPRLSD